MGEVQTFHPKKAVAYGILAAVIYHTIVTDQGLDRALPAQWFGAKTIRPATWNTSGTAALLAPPKGRGQPGKPSPGPVVLGIVAVEMWTTYTSMSGRNRHADGGQSKPAVSGAVRGSPEKEE